MATAPDPLSPELALIDPQLAEYARALLAEHADPLPHDGNATPPDYELLPVARPDTAQDETASARERLVEGGMDSDVLGSLVPSERHFRRRATLIPAIAAAAAVTLLVLQLYLNEGKLP